MIRFVYPNVDYNDNIDYEGNCDYDDNVDLKAFAGIGVFIASSKLSVDLNKYEVAKFNISNNSEISKATAILSYNISPKENWNVYAQIGDKDKWSGDSLAFAYLIALVNISLESKYETDIDIWFTGSIDLKYHDRKEGMPFLTDVFEDEFEIKLDAFLSQESDIFFIVPDFNINPAMRELCTIKNSDIITAKEFKKINFEKINQKKKYIITVNGDDLFDIRDALFKRPYFLSMPKFQTVIKIITFVILLITCFYSSIKFYNYWIFQITKNEAISFHYSSMSYFKKNISPAYCDHNNPPPFYIPNPKIQYKGRYYLLFDNKIIGKVAFSHIHSDKWIIIDEKGHISFQNSSPDFTDEPIIIFDYIAKNELEKFHNLLILQSKKQSFSKIDINANNMPLNYISNDNIEYGGSVSIDNKGIISGEMTFSHKQSETVFVLNHSQKITTKPIKKQYNIFNNMSFVWIPGGCYEMGCNPSMGYTCSVYETYIHTVCIDGFWMGKTEVTQLQWIHIMGYNPSIFKNCGNDCPVENISFKEINEFIRKLNTQLKNKWKVRLPTEAEWEYACRYNGNEKMSKKNKLNATYPVCQNSKNLFGLCGKTGNVSEICQDKFYKNAYLDHMKNNPISNISGTDIVVRGCDFSTPDQFSPCCHRSYIHINDKVGSIGFRIVWENL